MYRMNMKITIKSLCSIFLTLLIAGCKEEPYNYVKSDTVYERSSLSIDTLTLDGHRYFLVTGGMGTPQLQHEASCEISDYKSIVNIQGKDSLYHKPYQTYSYNMLNK